MAREGKHLTRERENKKDPYPHRDVALERSKRPKAYSRTDEGRFRKANWTCCCCHHSADGSEFL